MPPPLPLRPSAADAAPSWRAQFGIAALLFLAALVTRLPTFFRSVLDWDESLYFLMAQQWRHGHLPYTSLWDNKPIGIYGVFALFQAWFGDDVGSIRIASVLFVTAAAFAVFRIALLIPLSDRRLRLTSALFASIAYVVCSLSNDGLSANTEIFMACFSALGVLAALSGRGFAAGVMFGLAFMTKYVVLFEFPALAFALLAVSPRRGARAALASGAALLAGAALPLLATMALYLAAGHFRPWLEDSVLSNFRRVSVPVSLQALAYICNAELLRWTPLFLLSLAMLAMAAAQLPRLAARRGLPEAARFNLFLALWLVGGCIGVASAKSFFDHYFLQLLPVMCVTIAWMLLSAAYFVRRLPSAGQALLFLAILGQPLAAAATALHQAAAPVLRLDHGHISLRPDTPALIARDIGPLLAASGAPRGDRLYVFDYQPIIYGLVGARPPTRYAFPSVLTHCQLAMVANVAAVREIDRILAENPTLIIRARYPATAPGLVNTRVYAEMDRTLAARYAVWRQYPDAVVYRLRDPAAPVDRDVSGLPPACPKPAKPD